MQTDHTLRRRRPRKRAIQYSEALVMEAIFRSVLDTPLSRSMTATWQCLAMLLIASSQRLPYAEAEHEALPDLHGIAAGGADARLVGDPCRDQRRPGSRQRSIDQPLKILLVGGPGAVGDTAAGGDGDHIRHHRSGS